MTTLNIWSVWCFGFVFDIYRLTIFILCGKFNFNTLCIRFLSLGHKLITSPFSTYYSSILIRDVFYASVSGRFSASLLLARSNESVLIISYRRMLRIAGERSKIRTLSAVRWNSDSGFFEHSLTLDWDSVWSQTTFCALDVRILILNVS